MSNEVRYLIDGTNEDAAVFRRFFKDCYELAVSEKDVIKIISELFDKYLREEDDEILEAVELLIHKFGANINMPTNGGGTGDRRDFMYDAVKAGNAKAVKMLFENGYNGSTYIEGQYPIIHYVNSWGRSQEIRDLFKEYGYDHLKDKGSEYYIDICNDRAWEEEDNRVSTNMRYLKASDLRNIRNENPIAYKAISRRIRFMKEDAKNKLIAELFELGASVYEISTIITNGSFNDPEDFRKHLPIYDVFMKKHGAVKDESQQDTF